MVWFGIWTADPRRGRQRPDFLSSVLKHVNTFLGWGDNRKRRNVVDLDLEGDLHYIALRYVDFVLNRSHEEMEKGEEELYDLHWEMSQLGQVIFPIK